MLARNRKEILEMCIVYAGHVREAARGWLYSTWPGEKWKANVAYGGGHENNLVSVYKLSNIVTRNMRGSGLALYVT